MATTSTVHPDDAMLMLQHMLLDRELGCLTEKSDWPDFVSVLHHKGGLKYALWWQVKFLGGTTFSWADIQTEINKVPILVENSCLVIVSTSLSTEVASQIGDNGYLVIYPGTFTYKYIQCGIEMQKDALKIPDKLEVVILGEKGLTQLYSVYDLEGLRRLAAANSFKAISKRTEQPIGSLAGVTLSHAPIPGKPVQHNHNYSHTSYHKRII